MAAVLIRLHFADVAVASSPCHPSRDPAPRAWLSSQFGLNDKLLLDNEAKAKTQAKRPGSGIEIDDVSFHQCVKLGKFDMDRTISFVPPDGEFQLMR